LDVAPGRVAIQVGLRMDNQFFERPILNSPYDYPARYWELDEHG